MSKLSTLARVTVSVLVVGFAGCEKSKNAATEAEPAAYGNAAKATETNDNPAAKQPADEVKTKLATTGPTSDPHNGKFTLDEATKGLAGDGELIAKITTSFGTMTCTLMPKRAPETVASFVGLARGTRAWEDPFTHVWQQGVPFFDGLLFHRVMPNFMIQGGDPLSRDPNDRRIGTGFPGYRVRDETDKSTIFKRGGILAMANSGVGTNSGGSQFFITEVPKHSLDRGYTIFGQCDGVDVVKTIARQPVTYPNKPKTPITMKITISRK